MKQRSNRYVVKCNEVCIYNLRTHNMLICIHFILKYCDYSDITYETIQQQRINLFS